MSEFITQVATPGAAAFTGAELQEQAGIVRVARANLGHADAMGDGAAAKSGQAMALTLLDQAKTRHAVMLLHNRLVVVEAVQRAGPDMRHFNPNTR